MILAFPARLPSWNTRTNFPEEVDFKLALEKINTISMTVCISLLEFRGKERKRA